MGAVFIDLFWQKMFDVEAETNILDSSLINGDVKALFGVGSNRMEVNMSMD